MSWPVLFLSATCASATVTAAMWATRTIRRLGPEVETLFLTPKEELSYTSNRLVKQVPQLGGFAYYVQPFALFRLRGLRGAQGGDLVTLARSIPLLTPLMA